MRGATDDPTGSAAARTAGIRLRVGALAHRRVFVDGKDVVELLVVKVHVPTRSKPIWMVPGGGVEPGETLEKALFRELHEETGLDLTPTSAIGTDTFAHPTLYTPVLAAIHEFIEPPFHALEFYFWVQGAEHHDRMPEKPSDASLGHTGDPQVLEVRWAPLGELADLGLEPRFLTVPSFHLDLHHKPASAVSVRRNGA
jgi:8-oxo-dGTP diphosphatase